MAPGSRAPLPPCSISGAAGHLGLLYPCPSHPVDDQLPALRSCPVGTETEGARLESPIEQLRLALAVVANVGRDIGVGLDRYDAAQPLLAKQRLAGVVNAVIILIDEDYPAGVPSPVVRRHGYMAVPADRLAAGEMNAAQQGVDAAVHALIVDQPAEGGHAYGKHDCQYRNGNHHLDQGEATAGHGADLLRKGATANAAREHGRSGYNPGPGRQSGLGD